MIKLFKSSLSDLEKRIKNGKSISAFLARAKSFRDWVYNR
jgi:hypothetical protein